MRRDKEPEWYGKLNADDANRQADRDIFMFPFYLIALLTIGTLLFHATNSTQQPAIEHNVPLLKR